METQNKEESILDEEVCPDCGGTPEECCWSNCGEENEAI